MQAELNSVSVFVLVAQEHSFRAAADRLGVTRSAVSQAIRKLEETVGVALIRRTTRSVSLTEEGERLYREVAPAVADITASLATIRDRPDQPSGQLRLAVSSIAEEFLSGRMLGAFSIAYPEIEIYINVTDEEFDIVAEGYDAGVRLGEVIAQDMIALPVSGQQRQVPVCSPAYLERMSRPFHPRDLADHRCVNWRPAPDVAPFRWEFAEDGREFVVTVGPGFTTNDMALMVKLARSGACIAFGMEESFRADIAAGRLVPLLEEFCPYFPGFYLYYPNRRNMAPKMRALLDFIKDFR
ncbi:LysR family transcriptional regulator [Ciceribacter sp. L1K22]|uniref:LysR family transcriptional regulator n=1 Tax=Ciceribacter sp. L1K22 TaxID=2820275 RepID=UPI001ABEA144|nr:LysR family transcriptional regulator [Ciceribacter sp. L1K22]MBO3759343.1 LysR family transcriptional regulator [Ciceribacter sp. L1K22]